MRIVCFIKYVGLIHPSSRIVILRDMVLAVVLFFDYPQHEGNKLLVNIGNYIPEKAGILIDYH